MVQRYHCWCIVSFYNVCMIDSFVRSTVISCFILISVTLTFAHLCRSYSFPGSITMTAFLHASLFFSIVYHRLIYSTQSVGAMLWSMAQLRRGQLRMVVDVVGSCWWCGQLSVLARHTHMPHCPPVPTSSWKLCIDRPQFAVCLGSSSVFDSVLLPWRLLLGPIRGGVLGWVRMLPTPASMLPQSTHPSTGPQGWHLASPEPPCCRVYGTWVCMGALRSLSCRAGCASRLSLPSVPRQGWLLSALGRRGLSLLRQGAGTQASAWDNQIWSAESCWLRRQPSSRVGFCSRQGHSIQLRGIPGLAWRSAVFWQRLPRLYQQDDGWVRLWM